MSNEPQSLADEETLRQRAVLLDAPHMAPLTEFSRSMRGTNTRRNVPFFDPADGGIHARILVLLDTPGPSATMLNGSGFVSMDNDDPTAATLWRIVHDSGIPRSSLLVWNAIPWLLGEPTLAKLRQANRSDAMSAQDVLLRLLDLLPELQTAVLLGRPAQYGWLSVTHRMRRPIPIFASSDPNPRAWAGNPELREHIAASLLAAARLAGVVNEVAG